MLKKRIIPILLLKGGRMVKGKKFANFRDVGEPKTAVRIYSAQDADELIILDINEDFGCSDSLLEVLQVASKECFMPLTAGGGIHSISQAQKLFAAGADKVLINSATVLHPNLLSELATRFGQQAVVAGVDYRKREGNNETKVFISKGRVQTDLDPIEHALQLANDGAGEVILSCIDNDGMMSGYDLEFAAELAQKLPVPLIVNCGAGNFSHLADLLNQSGVSGAGCSSIFHFGDNNPIRARSYLRNKGIAMRTIR